jgi:hypothetical protein
MPAATGHFQKLFILSHNNLDELLIFALGKHYLLLIKTFTSKSACTSP